MSRTRKDSKQGNVLEIIKREDDTFDLFLNRRLDRQRIREDGLQDMLCVRFGYCGDELKAIFDELIQNGRSERYPN